MSGLVNGLQNRLRRFESARHLTKKELNSIQLFFILCILQHLDFSKLPRTDYSAAMLLRISLGSYASLPIKEVSIKFFTILY